ncbi:hypothetical protein [Nonomuraea polychroma]|nr:hypothetical protein [Nonomuraea polychroma]
MWRALSRPWKPRGGHPIGLWASQEEAEAAVAALQVRFVDIP